MAGSLVGSKAEVGGKLGAEMAVAKPEGLKSQDLRSCVLILGTDQSGTGSIRKRSNQLVNPAAADTGVAIEKDQITPPGRSRSKITSSNEASIRLTSYIADPVDMLETLRTRLVRRCIVIHDHFKCMP